LTLLRSALHVARTRVPLSQVQFVHTLHTGTRVNGVDFEQAHREALRFRDFGRMAVQAAYPDLARRVSFLTDSTDEPLVDQTVLADALMDLSGAQRAQLIRSSQRRGDHLAYIAAHLMLHDTAGPVIPLTVDEPVPVMPQILISLGAQSERPFYKARMAYRARGGPLPGLIAQTGQLFTHSALPPYMACREGEPSLAEAMAARPLPLTLHPVASVQRDLSYASGLLEELRAAGAFVN